MRLQSRCGLLPLALVQSGACLPPALLCAAPRPSRCAAWHSQFFPPLEDGARPSDELRKLEVSANEIFSAYREQYYEGGTSSVYLWDADGAAGAFAGCFLVHKASSQAVQLEPACRRATRTWRNPALVQGEGSGKHGGLEKGYWDAIHVFEVAPSAGGGPVRYSLTSTVMLHLAASLEIGAKLSLAGSLSRKQARQGIAAAWHGASACRDFSPLW